MTLSLNMRIAILAIAILLALPSATPFAREPLVLTTGEWPPYFSETFKHGGFGLLVASKAFAKHGIDVKYEFLPWNRSFVLAQTGQRAGTLGWKSTPQRQKDFYFSDPIFTESVVFFHRRDIPLEWETLDDLGSLRIGATLGYAYVDMLAEAVEKHGGQLHFAHSDELVFKMLIEGRIDIFPCAQEVGKLLLQLYFTLDEAFQVTFHPHKLYESPIRLLISRKTADGKGIIARFNEGLRELRESGEYDRLAAESASGRLLPGTP